MKYATAFGKTNKQAPHDADSTNARLLIQAGFINQLSAGVFTFMPMGLRVLNKVQNIVREEMNEIGSNEILMPALVPKENWMATDRWDKALVDVNYRVEGHGGKEYALGSTHEEVVTPLVKQFVQSYKDLPVAVYQIQDKFRNEPRAKSGLLRGREFLMKDLYSFHLTMDDFEDFYDVVADAYRRFFKRVGLDALYTEADGGAFSKFSHEFQVATENGEDIVFTCGGCGYSVNKEIQEYADGDACPKCGKNEMARVKAIEVGNIFPLKTRFTEAFDFKVQGPDGKEQEIFMGCYGIGMSRVMGAIVEVHNDDQGIIWPKEVAPFHVHLISLNAKDAGMQERIMNAAEALYNDLQDKGIEVFWDDRDLSAGQKFADADLIGIPLRLVVSEKTLNEDSIEWKLRAEKEARLVKQSDLMGEINSFMNED